MMLWLINQVFIALFCFSRSLAIKCASLKNEPYILRPTFIDLNSIDLNYYPFMIILDKCNESCNAVDEVSAKICAPSKVKGVQVKVGNMRTRKK